MSLNTQDSYTILNFIFVYFKINLNIFYDLKKAKKRKRTFKKVTFKNVS